jgi:2,4-dienoyl-CoA reductase-like NADH-dependent reductase (Old Yellow Enzyme family)
LIKKRGTIEEGYADLVAYGKPYIANPDLVERFEHNLALAEADQDTFYSGEQKDIPIIQTLLNKEFEKIDLIVT